MIRRPIHDMPLNRLALAIALAMIDCGMVRR